MNWLSIHLPLIVLLPFLAAPVGAHRMVKAALHIKVRQVARTRQIERD